MKKKNLGYRGYIFSRRIRENLIPQRVQNLVIRDYSSRKNLFFKLSATEFKMKECYDVFYNLLKDINKYEGLIFYSLFMLPNSNTERNKIYNFFLRKKKKLHFALEEIILINQKDILKIEKILKIKNNIILD